VIGNQRLRAARELGYTKLPCIVRENLSDEEETILLIEDNVRRRHLTPIEKARIISKLYRMYRIKEKGGRPRLKAEKDGKEGSFSNDSKNAEVTSGFFDKENQRKQLDEIAKKMHLTKRQVRKYKSVEEKLDSSHNFK